MAVKRLLQIRPQYDDGTGALASGYRLFFYAAGSSTKQNTYNSSAGNVVNTNPIVLSALGEPSVEIWGTVGQTYKIGLAIAGTDDPPASFIWTEDNVAPINDTTVTLDQWVSGPAPTYVSATSFTLVGDQTSTFHKGRRLKTTNTGGTVYSTITSTAFGALTTVTVANDSSTLDSGLSAVSYSLVAADNPSINADMVHRKGASVVSAATTDIWSVVGDFIHVTGTGGPITSFGTAPYAGAERTVIFDAAVIVTQNATSLICPGATNFFTAAGDRATVRADTTANAIFIPHRSSGLPPVGTSLPRSHLAGLALSTAGGSATMTVAAGQALDSTNVAVLNLANSLAKTTSAWAVGAGGGLDTGAIANTTWYYFWLITRVDTGVVDVLFSLSATAPTMPTNYTLKRRIGAGKTNGSAQWIAFTQNGDVFRWSASVLDIDVDNPGTSANTTALSVPLGFKVKAIIDAYHVTTTAGAGARISYLNISSPDQADEAASATAAPLGQVLSTVLTGTDSFTVPGMARIEEWTNTSGQIRYRITTSQAGDKVRVATLGWIDRRGRDD